MTVNLESIQPKTTIQNYESYLEQKVGSIFTSWKKNYYICLEGIVLIYTSNKDSKEVIGHIPISNISNISSLDNSTFQFDSDDKTYKFRISDINDKEKWMKLLSNIIKEKESQNNENKERNNSITSEEIKLVTKNKKEKEITSSPKKNEMNEKLSSIGKKYARIIKSYGYVLNPEDKLSEEILIDKQINNLINIKDPKIKARIHHGFMYKKHKVHDYFQKRWFFIFSSRPLSDIEYIQDDIDLDKKKQKDWLQYDTLYYFKYQDKGEDKENLGGLEMVKSHKIIHFEKEEKYFLNLDVGERVYDFYCDNKFDRDEWFEVLRNSRRTAKEYFLSKTKKPRNIEKLKIFFLKGEKDFIKKMESEKKSVVGNEENILEYDVFEFNQSHLKELILSTIDGCLSNTPAQKDLMKNYTEYMTKEFLEITETFWKKFYNKMEHADILKMSMLLLTFREELLDLNINDENLLKNGKELVKIYYKKTYQNILSVIESILKNEREVKGIVSDTGELYTQGPGDLFGLLSNTFDLVKENKNKCVYIEILVLFKESIKQYIIGIDTVLVNLNIIVDNKYLIAVANNSFTIINLLNNLIDEMKEMNVLTEEEINQNLQNNKLMYTINKISQYAISHFVTHFRVELGNEFKNINFVDLNVEKVLLKTMELFGTYKPMMSILVIKKCWNEILKLTIYHYICCLLTTANKKQKTVEELKEKVKYDTALLKETYNPVVGANLTNSTIKIMNDIVDFFDVRSYMITSSCLTFRQYIGKSFTIATMKYLIKLRSDFTSTEKDEAIEQCKELLSNYQEQDDANTGGYFQYIEKELKKQERDEKRQEKLLKLNQLNDGNFKEINQSLGRDSLLHSKSIINFNNSQIGAQQEESESESEEEEKEDEQAVEVMDLEDLLKEDSDDEEEKDEKKNEEIDKIEINVAESTEYKDISDIEHEGFMYKKSHSTWQKRFFQLKNGYLYWYLDKKSSIIQNKISIKDTEKVESHKNLKFLMRVKEEEEKTKTISKKEYKFKCETEEEKVAWIFAITNSMKKIKNSDVSKNEQKLNIKVRKKIIHDLFKFPDINLNLAYMREKVLKSMENENYFPPSQRKIEADKRKAIEAEEERKRKEKEEIERKKREEKEERERKKREEKERKKREEEEKDRQIEQDIKEGKDVGVKNRIKYWFKGLGKGKDKNEEDKNKENTANKNINNNINNKEPVCNNKENVETTDNKNKINNFNLDDFINDDEEEEKEEKDDNNPINKKDIKNENINNKKDDSKKEEINQEKKINEIKLEDFISNEEEDNKSDNITNKENNNKNKNEIINIEQEKEKNKAIKKDNINNNTFNNNKEEKKEDKQKVNIGDNNTKNDDMSKNKVEDNNNNKEEERNANIKKTELENSEDDSEKSNQNEKIDNQMNNIEKNNNKDEVIKTNFEEEEDIEKKIIPTESNANNSNLNNAILDLNDDEKSEESTKEKKKKKKGFFASLFSCNSTNEERTERMKKKKKKEQKEKSEQEFIKDEKKRMKKEQEELKKQKKQLELEEKKNKETQIRLNKKKLTQIIEIKDEETEENKDPENNKNKFVEESDEDEEKEKEENIVKESIDTNKENKNPNENKKNNNNDNITSKDINSQKSNDISNTIEEKIEENKINEEKKEEKKEENLEIKENVEENSEKEKEKKEEDNLFNNINRKRSKSKRRKTKHKKSFINEEDKIIEKEKESSDEDEKNSDKITHITNITNFEDEIESKSNLLFKNTAYAKHNNTQNIDESIFKDKNTFNRYSDNGTINVSNIGYNNDEEETLNNIVNFLGSSKENTNKNKTISMNNNANMDDDEDEKEYLNKKIRKKTIKNKGDIEIIPEKIEEEEDYFEEKRNSKLTINKFIPRNSSVQFAQAKNLGRKSSMVLRQSLNKNKYSDSISKLLVNKIMKADKLIKYMNNKNINGKINEKIEKIKNDIPDIKTKYETLMEEEQKNIYEKEIKDEEKKDENEEKVNDWFEGIFT